MSILDSRRRGSSKCSRNCSNHLNSRDFLRVNAPFAILALGLCGCQITSSDVTGSLGDKAETSRPADPRRDVEVYQERYRANPKDADAALQYGKALRATGKSRRQWRCWSKRRSPIPATRRCWPAMAARSLTTAISRNPSTCSARPIPPTIRIGEFSRRREQPSTSSAGLRKRGNIMRAHSRSRRMSRRCCRILVCPTCFRRICRRRRRPCALPIAVRVRIRGCGPIWRWWLACVATPPRQKRLRRPICHPRRRPQTSRN